MKCLVFFTLLAVGVAVFSVPVHGNDYSSFLSSNASLAVVVNYEYARQHGENIFAIFQKILSDTIRENLRNGGINVKYYSWNSIILKKDFLAAITVTDCESTWRFYEATRVTSILLIAITDANCPRLPLHDSLMIPIVENGDEYPQMILDVKTQQVLNWKTAIVLIDEEILLENSLLVESLMHESSRKKILPIAMEFYKVDNSMRRQRKHAAIRRVLDPFARRQNRRHQFIVFSRNYDDIIEVANDMQLFHIYNQWLIMVQRGDEHNDDGGGGGGIDTVTEQLGEGVNIAFAINETAGTCEHTINCTISEISMAFVTSISRMIVEEQAIYGEISDEEWEWIRMTKQEKQIEILKYMTEYLKQHSRCSSCARWRLETAISWGKISEHKKSTANYAAESSQARRRNFEFVNIGFWSPLMGFDTHELLFPHVHHYFRNISLDIITVHNPPWQILTRNSSGGIIAHSGIVMEIVKELSRILNFTYHLHEPKTTKELDFSDDPTMESSSNRSDTLLGSLTFNIPKEVVEMAQNNHFFMAAVAATIDEPESKNFNFTIPISVQKYSFISRKPDEISRIYLFTAPFTIETWACLVGVILLVAPMLYIINRFVVLPEMRTLGLNDLKNCFWYIYGALLQQSGMHLPQADSGRLVVGVWWIVVIVLVTTYCGNLVAFLTFPKLQPGDDFIFQLFTENKIEQFGLRNGSFFEKYATISTRQHFAQYLERAIVYSNDQSEGIEAVEKGVRVNVDWRINLQLVIQRHFEKDKECKFALSREDFVDEQIGMIMPANSPYLNLINEHIRHLFQMGFIDRWHETNLPAMDKCNGKGLSRQVTNHKVNMDDMQGCFLVLLIGFTLALFVVFFEFWYHHLYVANKVKGKKSFSS